MTCDDIPMDLTFHEKIKDFLHWQIKRRIKNVFYALKGVDKVTRKEFVKALVTEFIGKKIDIEFLLRHYYRGYRMLGMHNCWFKRIQTGDLTPREEAFLFWYQMGGCIAE